MPKLVIDTNFFAELLNVCEAVGIPASREATASRQRGDGVDARARVAVHEAGHSLASVLERVHFDRVEVDGPRAGRVVPWLGPDPALWRWPTVETRIAVDVAGMVAEAAVYGDADPYGGRKDLRTAVARAYIIGVSDFDGNEASHEDVRQQVTRVQEMFRVHGHALRELGQALTRGDVLTHAECVTLVRDAGVPVDEPIFDCVASVEENGRCTAACAEGERRDASELRSGKQDARTPPEDLNDEQFAKFLEDFDKRIAVLNARIEESQRRRAESAPPSGRA